MGFNYEISFEPKMLLSLRNLSLPFSSFSLLFSSLLLPLNLRQPLPFLDKIDYPSSSTHCRRLPLFKLAPSLLSSSCFWPGIVIAFLKLFRSAMVVSTACSFYFLQCMAVFVTPQIRDVTGQRQTYIQASEALTY